MVNCPNERQKSSKTFSSKYVLLFVAIVGVFSVSIYLGSIFIHAPSSVPSKPSEHYTTLTLALYQSVTYTQGDTLYEFSYVPSGQRNLLRVESGGHSESYVAVPGSMPNPFDLKVTIYSANERMIILHIIHVQA